MTPKRRLVWLVVLLILVSVVVIVGLVSGAGFFGGDPKPLRVLRAYFAAQSEYHAVDGDGDGYLEYAEDLARLKIDLPCSVPEYSFSIYSVPGERYAPDGGLLSGFILVAEPVDKSADAYLIDHLGEAKSMPALMLPEWLKVHSGAGGASGT